MTISSVAREDIPYAWKEGNPVPIEDLCLAEINYWGFDDKAHKGQLVVHKAIVQEIIEIFDEVFKAKYPIEKMELIDKYQANDDASMADNNSSAFCARVITGVIGSEATTFDSIKSLTPEQIEKFFLTVSKHSLGMAVDVNPFYNPYHKGDLILPKEGAANLDRTLNVKGMIREGDALYNAFASRGWGWGGNWEKPYKDWHHFELPVTRIISILTA